MIDLDQEVLIKKIAEKIILLLVFSIPLISFFSVKIIIVLLCLSIFSFTVRLSYDILLKNAWDIFLYLGVFMLGLFYTDDIKSGIQVLETNFSFLAITFVVAFYPVENEKKLRYGSYSFILGLIAASFICLIEAGTTFMFTKDINVLFYYQLTDIVNSHPTYFAYYLIFGITYLLYLSYFHYSKLSQWIIIPTILVLFLMLMLTGGTTSFVSLLFVFSFFTLKYLLSNPTKQQRLIFILVLIMMVSMFAINSLVHENRQSVLNDSWDRFVLWKSVIASNPNFIIGVGTGDSKLVLNAYYASHQMESFANDSLNAHNQFLQALFSNGIIGLISLLILLLRPLYLAFILDDSLGILIFFPFIIYGMTEVFLGRYQGVVFFSILHQVFVSRYHFLSSSRQSRPV